MFESLVQLLEAGGFVLLVEDGENVVRFPTQVPRQAFRGGIPMVNVFKIFQLLAMISCRGWRERRPLPEPVPPKLSPRVESLAKK